MAIIVWLRFTSVTVCLCWASQHLQSDQHRAFVLDASNYSVLDDLVAEMLPCFAPHSAQPPDETLYR